MSDEVAEAIVDFCNALESAIVNLRRQLGRRNGSGPAPATSEGWNPNSIKWEAREGSKGPYERSEDVNNLQFKALLKDLGSHNGKLTRDGLFYWTFQNGSTVGRKKARFQPREKTQRRGDI